MLRLKTANIPLNLVAGDRVHYRPRAFSAAAQETNLDLDAFCSVPLRVVEVREPLVYAIAFEESGEVPEGPLAPAWSLERYESTEYEPRQTPVPYEDLEDDSEHDLRTLISQLDYHRDNPLSYASCRKATSDSPLSTCLRETMGVLAQLSGLNNDALLHPFLQSIAVLGEGIEIAVQRISGERLSLHIPYEIKRCAETRCLSRMYHFTPLPGVALPMIAGSLLSYDTDDHSTCFSPRCVHKMPDSSPVYPAHAEGCDSRTCSEALINEEELISSLDRGHNPCLILQRRGDRQELVVLDDTTMPYIAVSHVWSHGMGNSSKNSLPWCQVIQLFRIVQSWSPYPIALWIDTLTVPINRIYKKTAITRLREVYCNAEAVVVLDKHLLQVGSNRLEQGLQILGSEWMTRLWTLQEGRLATVLLFQFQEGLVPLTEILDTNYFQTDNGIFVNLDSFNNMMLAPFFVADPDMVRRFGHLVENLDSRSVTEPADEPLCIATLLGLRLENLGTDITLTTIYRALSQDIPQDLIFVPGPKLEQYGLRWAPSTLLHHEPMVFPTYRRAILCDAGLTVRMDCLQLDDLPLDFGDHGVYVAYNKFPAIFAFYIPSFAFVIAQRASSIGNIVTEAWRAF